MLNLLIVTQYFYPENFRINDISQTLAAKGCRVTVLTGAPNYPGGKVYQGYNSRKLSKEKWASVDILRVPTIVRGKNSAFRLVCNYIWFIFAAGCYGLKNFGKGQFDVVFVYAPSPIFQVLPAYFIKLKCKIPLVTWVQDLWPECVASTGYIKSNLMLRALSGFVTLIYKCNNMILAQSNGFVDAISKRVPNIEVYYFPNPGDIEMVSAGSTYEDEGVELLFSASKDFTVVFAGNLGKVQSLPTILSAAKMLSDANVHARIVFVGAGSEEKFITDYIQKHGLQNVHMAGYVEPKRMPKIFERADALLVSLNNDSTLNLTVPAKVQAYLAAAKPIIGSISGDAAKIISESGAGLVAAAGDADALCSAIISLSKMSTQERKVMSLAGRKYYEDNFEINKQVDKMLTYFKILVNQ